MELKEEIKNKIISILVKHGIKKILLFVMPAMKRRQRVI